MVDKIVKIQQRQSTKGTNAKVRHIAVIDDFTNKSLFIDADFSPDISHGEAVTRFIKEGLPNSQIETFDTKSSKNSEVGIIKCLDELLKRIDRGEKYDALNLSFSKDLDIKSLSPFLNKKITAKNLNQHKTEIKQWIDSSNLDKEAKEIREIIHKLDRIESKGVKIYTIAGNEGTNNFNMFSLVNNVNTIGARDFNNKNKANFSADNSLVTGWETGEFQIRKLKNTKGNWGFDYTDDGTIDIYSDKTTSFIKMSNPFGLNGTSFSTPKALVKDIKKKK